jgi:trk system potassium uptake protein TrkA
LAEGGSRVVAVDRHESNVEAISEVVDVALTGDATDQTVLKSAGAADCDVGVVAIGEHTENSIIATLNLQDLGIGTIFARAMTPIHRRILRKLGIAQIINPEEESAVRLAASVSEHGVEQLVELGEGYSFVVANAPARFVGRSLVDLDLRRSFGINVVGIRRAAEGHAEGSIDFSYTRFILPEAETVVEEDDRLLLIGRTDEIRRAGDYGGGKTG